MILNATPFTTGLWKVYFPNPLIEYYIKYMHMWPQMVIPYKLKKWKNNLTGSMEMDSLLLDV